MEKWIRRYVAVSLVCFSLGVVAAFASLWWCAYTETNPIEVTGWIPNTIVALFMPASVGITATCAAAFALTVRNIWTGRTDSY